MILMLVVIGLILGQFTDSSWMALYWVCFVFITAYRVVNFLDN